MGGNTTNRRDWKEEEVYALVDKCKDNKNVFYNPITGIILNSKKSWKNSISVKMSHSSANLFFFLLEDPHFSKLSGNRLGLEDFNYRLGGFKKYTKEEIKNRLYCQLRDYTEISDMTKRKISNTLKEYNITERGKEQRVQKSVRMKRFYSTDSGRGHKKACSEKGSKTLRKRIESGDYTPSITNTWTHWDAYILQDGVKYKFRSSWEACFWYSNQHLEYETIRVKTEHKVYVSDFYDPYTNTLYEIKPYNRYNVEIKKMTALINYCLLNKINFVWINERNITNYLNIMAILENDTAATQYEKLKRAYGKDIKN